MIYVSKYKIDRSKRTVEKECQDVEELAITTQAERSCTARRTSKRARQMELVATSTDLGATNATSSRIFLE
jgi:hypothetical protein